MDIEYKGANCTIITSKKVEIAIDPALKSIGLKDQGSKATVQLLTQTRFGASHADETVVIDGPGEYEVQDVSIKGVAAQAHLDPKDKPFAATMYRIETNDIVIAVTGHINPELSEAQLEEIGMVDVVIVPVGGNGYTLDATGAVHVVRAIDPKVVIPTHYADKAITYEVPQGELEPFTKELGAPVQTVAKLKLKAGSFEDAMTVYQLTRTA